MFWWHGQGEPPRSLGMGIEYRLLCRGALGQQVLFDIFLEFRLVIVRQFAGIEDVIFGGAVSHHHHDAYIGDAHFRAFGIVDEFLDTFRNLPGKQDAEDKHIVDQFPAQFPAIKIDVLFKTL